MLHNHDDYLANIDKLFASVEEQIHQRLKQQKSSLLRVNKAAKSSRHTHIFAKRLDVKTKV